MLKAAGLPQSMGQSAAVSLLDCFIERDELLLVMERPAQSMDLGKYLQIRGGSLDEREAKVRKLGGKCFRVSACLILFKSHWKSWLYQDEGQGKQETGKVHQLVVAK